LSVFSFILRVYVLLLSARRYCPLQDESRLWSNKIY
jgi:hypothetical protein